MICQGSNLSFKSAYEAFWLGFDCCCQLSIIQIARLSRWEIEAQKVVDTPTAVHGQLN